MKLSGKVSLVTGAVRGIGKAIALEFARQGSDIIICDLKLSLLNKVKEEIEVIGRQVLAFELDVSNGQKVEEMVKHSLSKFGKIDIVVNNAAIHPLRYSIEEISEEEWEKVFFLFVKH